MKRFISKVLILSLVLSMFTIPVNAVSDAEMSAYVAAMYDLTTAEADGGYSDAEKAMIADLYLNDPQLAEKIDMFCVGVLTLDNKDEFVNMLVLLRDVDNQEEFLEVYKQMFNSLLDGQKERLSSFGATIDAAADFGNYFMNEEYSISNLEDYLGLGGDATVKPREFKVSLVRRAAEFDDATDAADADDLEAGLARINKLFIMTHLAQAFGGSKYAIQFLEYDFTTNKVSMDEEKAAAIIAAANFNLVDKIDTIENPIAGFQKLVDYLNGELIDEDTDEVILMGSSDKERILNYLGDYGFIVYPEPTVVEKIVTNTVTNTVTRTVVETEFVNEEVAQAAFTFRDILPRFLWASTAIRQLTAAEVILGKDEDTFDPAGLITRAEFAAMLTRMFDEKLPEDGPSNDQVYVSTSFSDVLSPAWFVDEIEAAYRAGYVKGIGNGLYGPYINISREQIATMIARVLEDEGVEAPAQADYDTILASFADATEVSSWAKPGSAMCADLGLITGSVVNGETVFGFGEYATRAEVAVILYRMVEAGLIETNVEVFNPETAEEDTLGL